VRQPVLPHQPESQQSLPRSQNCIVRKNECVHSLKDQIRNLTAPSAATCCAACAAETGCAGWNWDHPTRAQPHSLTGTAAVTTSTPAAPAPTNCVLHAVASKPNRDHSSCDSGFSNEPSSQPLERDYSAFIFAKEAGRIFADHAAEHVKVLVLYPRSISL
jgi:hypothetical protein